MLPVPTRRRGDVERSVTPARVTPKETNTSGECLNMSKFQLTTEGHIFAFLTYFEKLLHRSQSFVQRNFYRNLYVDHPSTIQPPEA